MTNGFDHPRRFPANAPGPFYTTGQPHRGGGTVGGMIGDCLQCEAPEGEAPELLAPLNETNLNTYFIRQPQNALESRHACNAIRSCCVSALRYGGTNRSIIQMLGNDPRHSDYIVGDTDTLVATVDADGDLHPFAQRIVDRICSAHETPDGG